MLFVPHIPVLAPLVVPLTVPVSVFTIAVATNSFSSGTQTVFRTEHPLPLASSGPTKSRREGGRDQTFFVETQGHKVSQVAVDWGQGDHARSGLVADRNSWRQHSLHRRDLLVEVCVCWGFDSPISRYRSHLCHVT